MRISYASLLSCLTLAVACSQNTDTSVSESAATTGVTVTTSGDPGASESTASSDLTGAVTGGLTSGEASTSGVSEGQSSGPGEPGTTTGDPGTTSLTTEDPGTSGLTTGGGGTTDETIDDCEELEAAFASEAAEIRSCVAAEECGQELMGTSCGCTRNWVARLDADTDHFYELLGKAERLGCELILGGTCDCPAADGFLCQDGICTWNYL